MPYTIQGEDLKIDHTMFIGKDFQYKYPKGLDLHPAGELHNALVARILRYGLESARIVSNRYGAWQAMDEKLQAFIPVNEAERKVQAEDRRKPISIVFPYSYAILETLVSYLVAAFLQDPIFRYEGNAPEDTAGAFLMEKVIATHCDKNKIALNLHTLFRDACAYGFGAVTPQWLVKMGTRLSLDERGERQATPDVLFEGNAIDNIDPYCYLPDPTVPLHDVQRGEFTGWIDRTNIMDLLSEESQLSADATSSGELFNVKYLQAVQGKTTTIFGDRLPSSRRAGGSQYDLRLDRMITDPVDQFNVHVKLIPKQWNIGTSQVPEKWFFTLAADSVIIRAKPLGLHHNMFPVCVAVPDFDGYSAVAYSRLEILSGMQVVVDWLFNSHIANVRKAINDVLIVDPYLINMNDLRDPGAGGLVRLRRPAWGKGVKDAAMQLNVVDITRQNIADVAAIIQYMQTIGATDSPVMGSLRQGGPERITRAEFSGTTRGAVNRLERVGRIVGIQCMQDISYMFAHHTQQLMSRPVWVQTVGEWPASVARNFATQGNKVRVSPDDLLIDYDLLMRDGSIPGGNFSEAWPQLFQTIASSEVLMQELDVVKIFKYIALNLGAKNVDDFEKRPVQQALAPQVAPDEAVADEVRRGNLVPAMGAFNGTT